MGSVFNLGNALMTNFRKPYDCHGSELCFDKEACWKALRKSSKERSIKTYDRSQRTESWHMMINYSNSIYRSHLLVILAFLFLRQPLSNTSPRPTLLRLSLFHQGLSLGLLCLHRVNCLKQHALVFELVTLCVKVESVINVPVNFLGVTHFVEETTEDADTTHPEDLERKTGVGSTTTLTDAWAWGMGNTVQLECETKKNNYLLDKIDVVELI